MQGGTGALSTFNALQRPNETSFSTLLAAQRSFNYSRYLGNGENRGEWGGCPNINTLRTIPGTRIRDKKQ